jgi:prevent-host-death family protein
MEPFSSFVGGPAVHEDCERIAAWEELPLDFIGFFRRKHRRNWDFFTNCTSPIAPERGNQPQPVDITTYLANNQAMKMANIAEFKNNLSRFIAAVENGEEVEIRRRNLPIAKVVPVTTRRANRTKLGCGRGTAKAVGDLTEPLIPEADWEMHKDG